MKKSGLADSPFFTKPSPPPPAQHQDGLIVPTTPVIVQEDFKRSNAQMHERTDAQLSIHTNAHLNERTDEQMHKRTNAQLPVTDEKNTSRPTTRESFDIYEDQLQSFEELRLRLKKERGRHITKGELMRELLEDILQHKK